jgi:hypothetical protein
LSMLGFFINVALFLTAVILKLTRFKNIPGSFS